MKGVKNYEVSLKSITPIVWDRVTRDVQTDVKEIKKNDLDMFWENNWWRKSGCLLNGTSKIYEENLKEEVKIFPDWILGMLTASAKKSRIIPHNASSKKATYTSYIPNLLCESNDIVCSVGDLNRYERYDVNDRGQKIWNIFPTVENWETKIKITDTIGDMLADELKTLLNYGGSYIGIGAKRRFNFGRFEVIEIKEIK